MLKKYLLYLLRWQLSGIVLYPALLIVLPYTNEAIATILANFVGGLIFFWVDLYILTNKGGKDVTNKR